MTPLILDLILGAIIVLTAIVCGKRGFYRILMPIVVFAAAVVCAGFLSDAFKAPVAEAVFPKIENKVVAALEQSEFSIQSPEAFVEDTIGLLPEGLQPLAQRLESRLTDLITVESNPESAVLSMAYAVTEALVRIVLWVILFLVGLVVFSLLKKVLGLVFKLPVISWLDHLGGFILGLIFSIFALYAVGWILTAFGITALHELGEGTCLFSRFF